MRYFPILFLLFTSQTFAIFCPTNFSSVNFGDSIEQIKQVCGNPNSINQYQKNLVTNQVWDYYIKSPGFDQNMAKMSVLFRNDQIMNINIHYNQAVRAELCPITVRQGEVRVIPAICKNFSSNENVASTDLCGAYIQVGNTSQNVQQACGQPALVKDLSPSNSSVNVIEFHYNGPPPITLIFEDGKLSDRLFQ